MEGGNVFEISSDFVMMNDYSLEGVALCCRYRCRREGGGEGEGRGIVIVCWGKRGENLLLKFDSTRIYLPQFRLASDIASLEPQNLNRNAKSTSTFPLHQNRVKLPILSCPILPPSAHPVKQEKCRQNAVDRQKRIWRVSRKKPLLLERGLRIIRCPRRLVRLRFSLRLRLRLRCVEWEGEGRERGGRGIEWNES